MILSCATLSAEGFGDTDFTKTFEMLPAAGYRYVEFNLWHQRMMLPETVRSLRDRCDKHGLTTSSVHCVDIGTAEGQHLSKEIAHKLWMLQICQQLGCKILSATGYKRGTAGGLEAIVSILKELVPFLEANDLHFSLENHKDNNLEFIEDYEQIFVAVDSDHVGVCIDTGHFDASAVPLDEVVDRLGRRVNHIHVKENRGVGTQQFVRFGEGTTDNHRLLLRMRELGYGGYVIVELSPQPDRPASVEDLSLPHRLYEPFLQP